MTIHKSNRKEHKAKASHQIAAISLTATIAKIMGRDNIEHVSMGLNPSCNGERTETREREGKIKKPRRRVVEIENKLNKHI